MSEIAKLQSKLDEMQRLTQELSSLFAALGPDAVDRHRVQSFAQELMSVATSSGAVQVMDVALLKEIFMHSLDLICVANVDGSLQLVNPSFIKTLGFSEAELLSQPFYNLIHSDDIATTERAVSSLANGQSLLHFEIRCKTKAGDYRIISWHSQANARTGALYSVGRDITAQKQMEREGENLRRELELSLAQSIKSEKSFRAIFEHSPLGMVKLDRKLKMVSVNSAFSRFLGYSEKELLSMTILDVTHPDDIVCSLEAVGRLAPQQQMLQKFEKRYVHKSGRVIWGLITSRAVQFEHTGEQFLFSVIEDVTELRRKDETLKLTQSKLFDSEQNLRVVLQNVPSMIFVKDHKNDMKFSLLNRAGEELLGVKETQFLGKTDYDLFPKEQADFFRQKDREVFASHGVLKIDKEEVNTPVGKKFLTTYKVPTYDSEGKAHLLIGISNDITEEVLAKAALETERIKSIQNAKLASLGEMSAGVAHEINNPLAIISGAASLLEKSKDDPAKFAAKVDAIQRSTARIAKIVDGLRKFARTPNQTGRVPVVLANIVREALALTEAKAHRHQVRVYDDLLCSGKMLCDEVEIEQVLVNLVNNAIDAVKTQDEKWVRISVTAERANLVLRVRDSGTGIPCAVADKLFQPFFTTKPVGHGTGLGLSIVKGILDQYGATISLLRSEPNTCFEILIPQVGKN